MRCARCGVTHHRPQLCRTTPCALVAQRKDPHHPPYISQSQVNIRYCAVNLEQITHRLVPCGEIHLSTAPGVHMNARSTSIQLIMPILCFLWPGKVRCFFRCCQLLSRHFSLCPNIAFSKQFRHFLLVFGNTVLTYSHLPLCCTFASTVDTAHLCMTLHNW